MSVLCILLIADIEYAYYKQLWSLKELSISLIGCIVACIITVLLIVLRIINKHDNKVLEEFQQSLKDPYLCGFKLSTYLETNAFHRMAEYFESGICWELAAYAMFALKDSKTAVLYHGCTKKGIKHSWVEFKIPGMLGWYVADFAWTNGFVRRFAWRHSISVHDWKLTVKKRVSYDEFWNMDLSKDLYERTQAAKTSYVLDIFVHYTPDFEHGYEYHEHIKNKSFSVREPEKCTGGYMHPFIIGEKKRVMWANIPREFARNPKRKRPRARAIRIANHVEKVFLQCVKEAEAEAATT